MQYADILSLAFTSLHHYQGAFQRQRNYINEMLRGNVTLPPFLKPACPGNVLAPFHVVHLPTSEMYEGRDAHWMQSILIKYLPADINI
jgi:hypothetical protein